MKYFLSLITISLVLLLTTSLITTLGAESDSLPATIKIGVCGDGVAEGVEECDNEDLLSKTCESLDYLEGTLSCDPSCNLNTSLCIPKPEPEPPVEEPDESDDDDDDNDNEESTSERVVNLLEEIYKYLTGSESRTNFPEYLKYFDINSDNKIEIEELYDSAKRWFDYWKEYISVITNPGEKTVLDDLLCDLNNDGKCNLVDFSILMYHVNKED